VPVYNAETTLRELVDRIFASLSALDLPFELILVNDGSDDRSWDLIRDIAQANESVTGLDLMKNYGQHNAVLAGVMTSHNDFIVTIDDDAQYPPESIPALLESLEEGNDIAYGKARTREQSFWRNACSRVLKAALRTVPGAQMGYFSSSFRAFRSELKRGFSDFRDPRLSIDVLLSWSAKNVALVPVRHEQRRGGRSGYTPGKLLALTVSIITGYSTLPLRIASAMGLATAFIGFVLFIYLVIKRLLQDSYVPGFAFIASEIALFAGLQLLAIGIIGEYLAGVVNRTMGKPPYVIREQTKRETLSK
jgi:undecaprenyl-phosphate 4-deoxy-4-formamido-L-arabinose transferase